MKAPEFNELQSKIVSEEFAHLNMKKQGVHYYIHQSPNVMMFHKHTSGRGIFEGFYITLSHDFVYTMQDKKGRLKVQNAIQQYPITIPVDDLKEQYSRHKSCMDFQYDLNFITRPVIPIARDTSKSFSLMSIMRSALGEHQKIESVMSSEQNAEKYIRNSLRIFEKEGMRFLDEFTPLLSVKSIVRGAGENMIGNWDLLPDLLRYLDKNKIEIPKEILFDKPIEIAQLYRTLALAAHRDKKFEDAEVMFKHALQLMENYLSPNDEILVECSNEYADFQNQRP